MNELKQQDLQIRDAQYRKGLSIAFFNATNAAIELAKIDYIKDTNLKEFISNWRNWFLEEHKTYYATVIANVGANYRAEDSIAKLKATKTLEELKTAWICLSADERANEEIIKVVNELKGKYNEK